MALQPNQYTIARLRQSAAKRADMPTPRPVIVWQPGNETFVSTQEWNDLIAQAVCEVYDLRIMKYGDNYQVAPRYSFTTDGINDQFALPADFYKLLGVDLQYFNSPTGWVTLRRFNMMERNKYGPTNMMNLFGRTNLEYDLVGANIQLIPIPQANAVLRLYYVPRPGTFTDMGSITLFGTAAGDTATINGVTFTASTGSNPVFAIGSPTATPTPGLTDAYTAVNLGAVVSALPWTASTYYAAGSTTANLDGHNFFVYLAVTAGTSAASGGPTGGGFNIPDGSDGLTWSYIGQQITPWYAGWGVVAGFYTTANGNIYQAATGGTTATAPSGTSSGIVDGTTVTWNYLSPVFTNLLQCTADGSNPVVTVNLSPVASVNGGTVTWSSSQSMAVDPQPGWTNIIDGISGWDEFVVIDAALKAKIKQDDDPSALALLKAAFIERIEAAAENRDAGRPQTISDVSYTNNWPGSDGYGAPGPY